MVREVEKVSAQQGTVFRRATLKVDSHTLQLRDLHRHMEDLDNGADVRGVRGLPESVEVEQLSPIVASLFNSLLDRPAQTVINMERIHRALRPKGRDTDPPRDIICCLVDFKIKEEILRKSMNRSQLVFERAPIQIFRELSTITLQYRRDLKPLLDTRRAKGIKAITSGSSLFVYQPPHKAVQHS